MRQSILDEFETKPKDPWARFPEDIKKQYELQEAMKREHQKHLAFMEKLFAQLIEDLERRP